MMGFRIAPIRVQVPRKLFLYVVATESWMSCCERSAEEARWEPIDSASLRDPAKTRHMVPTRFIALVTLK